MVAWANGTELPLRRTVRYAIEAFAIRTTLRLCRLLPLRAASAFGGWLFRTVGPFLKADKVARRNLVRAFPDWDKERLDSVIRGMWDNLGRGAGEYSQVDLIQTVGNPDVDVVGEERLSAIAANGPFVIFSGHLANWEMASLVAAHRGYPMNNVYRTAQNPWMEGYFRRIRGRFTRRLLPKGVDGVRQALKALKRGEPLGVLIDQKYNEGVPIPFFGRDAMTATAPAELALKTGCPLVPVQLERLGGPRFRVTIHPPMTPPDASDTKEAARLLMADANAMLEDWIRARPEQWFWVHKRWSD